MEDEIDKLKQENEKLKQEIEELKSKISDNNRGEIQKKGMMQKASKGNIMTRPAFGYKLENSKLIPAENFREVEEIFEEFLTTNISLTQLSKKHNFSVNGLKKILKNFTYIGKIKFNNQIHEGNHQPIISSTLFNHVQNKLEKIGIK
ncbi:MAG TPA: hypothetical protein ENG87_01145 [Candidatus Pacearchaeota archaeon]|nr:recombinase [archaeon BMS3Abin17]HDK41956.1 hypothetical protein [Candidatus Pacearchaeota archaeon]HDZ60565.1 hypothetical protein [Candidatus Pacearchaeota archaeon]